MWFKTNIIVIIYFIIILNAKEIDVNREKRSDGGGHLSIKDLINAERMRNQYHRFLDGQLKWFDKNELYNLDRIEMLIKEQNKFDQPLIPTPTKKATISRLCGTKLVEAVIKMCNGCVKPVGGKAVTVKRCKFKFSFIIFFFITSIQFNDL
ncbi:unnamed protein product [Cercopithifilaria johnstoni]|uniref:Uncharacterized protein n=1 Tax=Cercopithifilaria johnstoni TaxID=2874296 RepID=A0A8J2LTN6_9BILA|nr:unnamed protein product [Cercopithifilaria johnstoni]